MTNKDLIKTVDSAGTKISKDKLLDALRRTSERDFNFVKDPVTGYVLVKLKI